MVLSKSFSRIVDGAKHSATQFARYNARFLAGFVVALIPVMFYVLGYFRISVVVATATAATVILLVWILRKYATIHNRSDGIPKPPIRFTTVLPDGSVSMDTARVQEMMVFVADYEDWLERSGL